MKIQYVSYPGNAYGVRFYKHLVMDCFILFINYCEKYNIGNVKFIFTDFNVKVYQIINNTRYKFNVLYIFFDISKARFGYNISV